MAETIRPPMRANPLCAREGRSSFLTGGLCAAEDGIFRPLPIRFPNKARQSRVRPQSGCRTEEIQET